MRIVLEHAEAQETQWAAIRSNAEKIGCTAETLRKWVRQAERDAGSRPGLTTDEREEREELKQLKRENREPKRANEILRKASALFCRTGAARPLTEVMVAFIVHTGPRMGSSRSAESCWCPGDILRARAVEREPELRSERAKRVGLN